MRTPRNKSWLSHSGDHLVHSAFHGAFAIAALLAGLAASWPVIIAAQASDKPAEMPKAEVAGEELTSVSADYRLAAGDQLTIAVYDQPQLSGDFIIDGGGGVLLPLAGPVSIAGLTLVEAQKLIQDRFGDGVLVQPAVSLRITEFRPIFVSGNVKKPGGYRFMIGQSVKAAIAAAGGVGEPLEQTLNGAVSDFITAEQHVNQLEAQQAMLLVRKARLEAQRDGKANFMLPMPVDLTRRTVDFSLVYASENEIFSRLEALYRDQIQALQSQRPRIEAEINAVSEQILKQKQHLDIVNGRLIDLEGLFAKGLLRKDVLLNQQIEKTLVEGQTSNLQAQLARLQQAMGELDIKLGDVKANYLRQTLADLQDTSQRLREVDMSIGPARRLLKVKAQGTDGDFDDSEYVVRISRIRDGSMTTIEAAENDLLSPGDVVEVKRKRHDSDGDRSLSTQAMMRELEPSAFVAEGGDPPSK
jgi:polysaccharide export outer membrane protein